ncbi:DUF1707 and DUF4190 domain-containing protein [Kitasatospora sp. NBC_01266]|uniref:DUF1707 and DUF4190 domain-containing protein n=1 Tax=Kitasatospora sp. NBC_01266 TaxID=2903572 RepID=UPI002E3022C3|nr:DUF1707 and DUF4190 domain-containing protein [Kitasatospora sp. NBC_01266]
MGDVGDMQPWPSAQDRPGRPQGGWQPAQQNPGYATMRAAHTDRDRTVDVLKAAYAEGRLSAAEYSARFDLANQAQTYGQLAQLVADLPSGPMPGPMPGLSPVPPGPPVPSTFLAPARPANNNGAAIASLVLGLLCVPSLGTLAVPALVTGHLARRQIRRTQEGGDGMATFGLVMGYLSLAGWSLAFFLVLLSLVTHY